ncbi:hypothetical protein ACFOVU_09105 [Nocardiopsis sediminis]|uniref:Uncharacterized protein n=1 Tax=Nocardiopsis sediminis TaxID=1778267 RepID=A0ABV8FIY6_9ACTN
MPTAPTTPILLTKYLAAGAVAAAFAGALLAGAPASADDIEPAPETETAAEEAEPGTEVEPETKPETDTEPATDIDNGAASGGGPALAGNHIGDTWFFGPMFVISH